jgi:CheY-like chemotaxis protein
MEALRIAPKLTICYLHTTLRIDISHDGCARGGRSPGGKPAVTAGRRSPRSGLPDLARPRRSLIARPDEGWRTQVAQRVLVVDDLDEMRVLIRRALSANGYEVDVAGTLAEAQGMDPAGYDAVLVDAHLGSERGIDLIETLRSQDPAAAGRCLVLTGGATEMFPEGVPILAKPFQLSDLLAAVRALQRPGTLTKDGQAADVPADADIQLAALVPRARSQPAAGESQLLQMLSIVRRLRERERRGLIDYLHDGPIQELTAASMELQMMRREVPPSPAPHVDSLLRQVDAASASLRWLVDELWPFLPFETDLTEAIHQRTAWLLATPATVDDEMRQASPGATEASLIADVVELMLLASEATPTAQAHIVVRMEEQPIHIDLRLTAVPDGDGIGDPATAQASLERLASALGASMQSDFSDQQWQVRLALRM